jgi:DHA2 family multidrug resistance protein
MTAELSKKQLLAFFAMVVGMFMAILDIQIVASSLSVIAAGLSASNDELSWVQTSYLIAEVIIIPLTGFSAKVLSTRISYFIAVSGFTIMSVFCSIAWNIESMILFRSLQGFFGGAMIPITFSTIYIVFPPEKRPMITVLVGLVVTVAPTLGPTLGGYITEIASWHFMFLVNLVPGIVVSIFVLLYVDFDKSNYSFLKNFDFLGIILMIITLASLQYILEEGNKKGWLDDSSLAVLSLVTIVSFVWFLIRELTFINPILDLTTLTNKDFAFGCFYSFIMGIGLYGAIYLLPLFLFTISGFTTLQIGITMMVTGCAQFISAPIAARAITAGMDLRLMLAFGLGMFGFGCYLNSFLTIDSKFDECFVPQFVRGFSLMFCYIPTSNIALGNLSISKIPNATGLYSLTRNLGGAVGLAMINSILINNNKVYYQYINENISIYNLIAIKQLQSFREMFEDKAQDPDQASFILLANIINKDAFIIAINNLFSTIGLIFFLSMIFLFFTSHVTSKKKKLTIE